MNNLRDKIIEEYERNIAKEVRDYIELTEGWWTTDKLYRDLDIKTKHEKGAVRAEIYRLVRIKELRKDGRIDGRYKRVQPLMVMDWKSATADPIDIEMPFGLQKLVNIYPGNIIICAGRQNSGKSALAYEFINLNLERVGEKGIYLYNNECGPNELHRRLSIDDSIDVDLWDEKVVVGMRSGDFDDAIEMNSADKINVIDYLTDYREVYQIGSRISEIYDVIRNAGGICWINIQKDQGNDDRSSGRGGAVTLDIPRLYLSLDYKQIKIVKAKVHGVNGMVHDFRTSEQGTLLPAASGWYYPEKKQSKYRS